MSKYGKELILDLHDCKSSFKFNRKDLDIFFKVLCNLIGMKKCKRTFWDYKGYPEEYEKAPIHLKGTSAVQFISTSNITIHTLDEMKRVYLNIFSCKPFDEEIAIAFCQEWFAGKIVNSQIIDRF